MTRVSVVIPTWGRAGWLDRCLRSVLDGERGADEVLVVGRSDDVPARRVVANLAGPFAERVRWVEVDGPGHVAPVRRGLEAATGDVVAFLDDDAEPAPNWLATLVRPFKDEGVASAGPPVHPPGSTGKANPVANRIRLYGKYMGNVGAL